MTAPAQSETEDKANPPDDGEQRLERQLVLGLMVGGIVHEIANPLNAILMNAELGLLLLEQHDEPEKLGQILGTITQEAKRGGSLGQELLRFARTDDYSPQAYADLNEVVTQAGKLLGSKPRRSGTELVLRKADTLAELKLNATALTLALASLIDVHLSMGAERIEVAVVSDPSHLIIELSLDRRTSANPPNDRFTELVFSFARRVLQAHNGKLDLESGISLYLPLTLMRGA